MPSVVPCRPSTGPSNIPQRDRLLGPSEVAHLLGCSTKTIRRMAERGKFPRATTIGVGTRAKRWRETDVLAWILATTQS